MENSVIGKVCVGVQATLRVPERGGHPVMRSFVKYWNSRRYFRDRCPQQARSYRLVRTAAWNLDSICIPLVDASGKGNPLIDHLNSFRSTKSIWDKRALTNLDGNLTCSIFSGYFHCKHDEKRVKIHRAFLVKAQVAACSQPVVNEKSKRLVYTLHSEV
jgi:hypothetical protein